MGRGQYPFPRLEGRAVGGLALTVFDVCLGEQFRERSPKAADLLVQGGRRSRDRVSRLILERYTQLEPCDVSPVRLTLKFARWLQW